MSETGWTLWESSGVCLQHWVIFVCHWTRLSRAFCQSWPISYVKLSHACHTQTCQHLSWYHIHITHKQVSIFLDITFTLHTNISTSFMISQPHYRQRVTYLFDVLFKIYPPSPVTWFKSRNRSFIWCFHLKCWLARCRKKDRRNRVFWDSSVTVFGGT